MRSSPTKIGGLFGIGPKTGIVITIVFRFGAACKAVVDATVAVILLFVLAAVGTSVFVCVTGVVDGEKVVENCATRLFLPKKGGEWLKFG